MSTSVVLTGGNRDLRFPELVVILASYDPRVFLGRLISVSCWSPGEDPGTTVANAGNSLSSALCSSPRMKST